MYCPHLDCEFNRDGACEDMFAHRNVIPGLRIVTTCLSYSPTYDKEDTEE